MVPNTRGHDTNVHLRSANTHTNTPHRTTSYHKSFFPTTIKQWNQLPETTRNLSHKKYRKQIREQLGPPVPPNYYISGTKEGNILHTRIRNGMTHLNSHLYRIQKCPTPACSCGYPDESPRHFILSCPNYNTIRTELIDNVTRIIGTSFNNQTKSQQLLTLNHGTNLCGADGREVARLFQKFLIDSHRFPNPY